MFWNFRNKLASFLLNPRMNRQPTQGKTINITGDRDVEWAWIASRVPESGGQALDFGNGGSSLGLFAALKGFNVLAMDLEVIDWRYRYSRLTFQQCDLMQNSTLQDGSVDLIISCSVIEHVGLKGRYGVEEQENNGDLAAMLRMRALMNKHGIMLMTIPVGRDCVYPPYHRVYGADRLPLLMEGFVAQEQDYWIKNDRNKWVQVEKNIALDADTDANSSNPLECLYGLGCFVLRKA